MRRTDNEHTTIPYNHNPMPSFVPGYGLHGQYTNSYTDAYTYTDSATNRYRHIGRRSYETLQESGLYL